MSDFDARAVAQGALKQAAERFQRELTAMIEADPDLLRYGAAGLLRPRMSGRDKTQARKDLRELAQRDPQGFEAALEQAEAARGHQPVMDLLTGGKRYA